MTAVKASEDFGQTNLKVDNEVQQLEASTKALTPSPKVEDNEVQKLQATTKTLKSSPKVDEVQQLEASTKQPLTSSLKVEENEVQKLQATTKTLKSSPKNEVGKVVKQLGASAKTLTLLSPEDEIGEDDS